MCRTGKLLISLALLTACAQKPPTPPAPPQLSPAEMEQAFIKASTPGDEHMLLGGLEGNWTAVSKFWMAPNAKPVESPAKSLAKTIYGGRFLTENYSGSWDGKPFEGTSLMGYDNIAKKFQSVWVDSMMTSIMTSSGTYNPATKQLTLTGVASCPMAGGDKKTKSVMTIVDEDHHTFEMFDKLPDGMEFKSLEINYTRAKGGKQKAKAKAKK